MVLRSFLGSEALQVRSLCQGVPCNMTSAYLLPGGQPHVQVVDCGAQIIVAESWRLCWEGYACAHCHRCRLKRHSSSPAAQPTGFQRCWTPSWGRAPALVHPPPQQSAQVYRSCQHACAAVPSLKQTAFVERQGSSHVHLCESSITPPEKFL